MKKLISNETKLGIITLGLYQIVGGAVGVALIIWSIFKGSSLNELTGMAYLVVLLFFVFSILCGILCLLIHRHALKYALINQIMQVFGFAMMGLAFKYVAGLYLTIGLNLTNQINFEFGVGISKFNLNFNIEKDRLEVDFNLVAFVLIYWIDKLIKKVKEEVAIREVYSIGNQLN